MTADEKGKPRDPDLVNAEIALKRAAKKALMLARKTKTPFYVIEDGKIVDIGSGTHYRGRTKKS